MTLRRWLVLIGAVVWLALGAAWYLDVPMLGRSVAPGWLVYLLVVLPLLIVFELLGVLRERVVKRWKETHRDA